MVQMEKEDTIMEKYSIGFDSKKFVSDIVRGLFLVGTISSIVTVAPRINELQLSALQENLALFLLTANIAIFYSFFLVLGSVLSFMCYKLIERERYLQPGFTGIVVGAILLGLNSLGPGSIIALAGTVSFALAAHPTEKITTLPEIKKRI